MLVHLFDGLLLPNGIIPLTKKKLTRACLCQKAPLR